MPKCWFCGDYCNGKTKVFWAGNMEIACFTCFNIWAAHNYQALFDKLEAKMKRECPLPDDYKVPGRKK